MERLTILTLSVAGLSRYQSEDFGIPLTRTIALGFAATLVTQAPFALHAIVLSNGEPIWVSHALPLTAPSDVRFTTTLVTRLLKSQPSPLAA